MKLVDYGDHVEIAEAAPARFRPGQNGAVISLYESQSEAFFKATGVPIGEIAVGVEFGDGKCIEVPLRWVGKAEQRIK